MGAVDFTERLRQALARRGKQRISEPGRVPAAVLLLIYCKEGEHYLLLVKRTRKVRYHKGQMSFPGGACEQEDCTLLATVLRECEEELKIPPEKVEVLGEMDDFITTTSHYIISPVVGFLRELPSLKPDTYEIERVLEVPISALLEPGTGQPATEMAEGKSLSSYHYYYQGEVIWGATARILHQFLPIYLEALGEKSPACERS